MNMFQNFLLKKMMEKQLSNVPADQREKILKAVTENPEFFEKIAQEIKAKMDAGQDQMAAAMSVMSQHQSELSQLLKK